MQSAPVNRGDSVADRSRHRGGLMLTSAHPPQAGVDGEIARLLLRFGATLDTGALMGAVEYGLTRSVLDLRHVTAYD